MLFRVAMIAATLPLFVAVSVAGPITFNSALPLSEGVGVLRSQITWIRQSGDTTAQKRRVTVTAVPLVLAYGVSPKLALFGMLPYVNKSMDLSIGAQRVRRSSQGVGDAKFFARYTVYQRDRPGDTLRVAPFVGLKTPTGAYQQQDRFGLLPRPLQSGSGSWDPFAGVAVSRQTLDWEFDSAASYRLNTAAAGFAFGDEARLDASLQYRLLPRSLADSGVPAFVYAVLESNLVWDGKNSVAGVTDHNSGGTVWSLTPGLQYVTRRYVLETAVQIPTVQHLHGTALRRAWSWTAGFRCNF